MSKVLGGKEITENVKAEVKLRVVKLKAKFGVVPKLVVILVGEDSASQIYVRNKERGCHEVGMSSETRRLPLSIKQDELIGQIKELNADHEVSGILVQLPLPKSLNENAIIESIDPRKDVDGIHPVNMGLLLKGDKRALVPCTPQGIIELLLSTGVEISGKDAVVIGRSNIVGKPVSILLMQRNATVTICHSKTKDLSGVIKRADIVVAAIGKKEMITGDMIKEGAIVIDVGINREDGKLYGDVEFESAKEKASYITPVPGGVGLTTIAMLLRNTVYAAELAAGKNS